MGFNSKPSLSAACRRRFASRTAYADTEIIGALRSGAASFWRISRAVSQPSRSGILRIEQDEVESL